MVMFFLANLSFLVKICAGFYLYAPIVLHKYLCDSVVKHKTTTFPFIFKNLPPKASGVEQFCSVCVL